MFDALTIASQEPTPRALAFFLHGRGANGLDLLALVEALALPALRYYLPDAPYALAEFSEGRQWYEFGPAHAQGVEHSSELLTELIRAERRRFGDLPVLLAGFSQGAVLALSTGLLLDPPPAAIVALSGYLFEPERLWALRPAALPWPAVLIVHGEADPVIPVRASRLAKAALTEAGVTVEYQEYAMGHQINQAAVARIRTFIERLLPA
ncbi:alpha/beta hydrolase [Gloeobacter kilaueensis]|uniref:Carboxylesterase n=1 Tax=Gloeobacter kilaueensis (strain ATCC BAA-2537 / CCAP 1431/1 / ULC 316 / JS1) TaxID=1183438 RepID=U5QJV4_GLOK1|nr:carboxylesterase [Gloeobacter kilaueensis]AGY57874.1 carboxylesterase [Gloeobacter kilaueensis JS1]